MKTYRLLQIITVLLIIYLAVGMRISYASGIVTFGPRETKINGSIKYTVIGRYNAQFGAFQGVIRVDEQSNKIQSVYLEIETASIKSNCQWCDKIVRSEKLLYASKYPKIIFKSNELIPNGTGYTVKGTLDLHGVQKSVSFPFQVKMDPEAKTLDVQGQWLIRRKDFNINWNKILDRGGVLVGNHIRVDWGIKARIKTELGEKESIK